jgi:hypothetical protein
VPGRVCLECGGRLIGWGGYWRRLRRQLTVVQVWVPRRRCRSCGRTQSLLPPQALERRLDAVETIGDAVLRKLSGATIRATAEALGLPSTTVRDWLSRYHERAPSLGRGLMAWAIGQGVEVGRLQADEDRQAVAALGAAWHAWHRRGRWRPMGPWRLWGLITGGRALTANRSRLFQFNPDAEWMAAAPTARAP